MGDSVKRRALAGVGEGLAGIGEYMLRNKMLNEQSDRILGRQEAMSERSMLLDILKKVMSGELDPAQAQAFGLPAGLDPTKFMPSEATRAESISDELQKMDFGQLQNAKPRIRSIARRRNIPLETQQLETQGTAMGFPIVTGVKENPTITELDSQADNLLRGREMQMPTTQFTSRDARGLPVTRFEKTHKLAGQSFQAEATPEQLAQQTVDKDTAYGGLKGPEIAGANKRRETLANELSPEITGATVTQQNAIESGTRGEKVATQGAISQAATAGQQRGLNSPEAILGAAQRAGAIAAAEAQARLGTEKPTQAERDAAGMVQQLASDNAQLDALEEAGVRMPISENLTDVPAIGNLLGHAASAALYSSEEQVFVSRGTNFINLVGRILSGVTVRPDERMSFLRALIAQRGDTPDRIEAKRKMRQAFLGSAFIKAGRAGGSAGEALADMVIQGALTPEVIQNMQLSTGEVLAGFAKKLGGNALIDNGQGRAVPLPNAGPRNPNLPDFIISNDGSITIGSQGR